MNVSLTPELEALVNEKVKTGLYQTASEVVREALRLLKERGATTMRAFALTFKPASTSWLAVKDAITMRLRAGVWPQRSSLGAGLHWLRSASELSPLSACPPVIVCT